MKLRSFKMLSLVLSLAFVLSIVPSKSVSAASKYPATIKEVYITRYAINTIRGEEFYEQQNYGINNYCLNSYDNYGPAFPAEFYVKVSTKAKDYNIKCHYKGYGVDKTVYNTIIPRNLPIGRYTVDITVYGSEIRVAKTTTVNLCIVSKKYFEFTRNLFIAFADKKDEDLSQNCYELAYDLSRGKTAKDAVGDVFYKYSGMSSMSSSNPGPFVEKMYKGVFGRQSDLSGFEFWCKNIKSGIYSKNTVLEYFTTCEEFETVKSKYDLK